MVQKKGAQHLSTQSFSDISPKMNSLIQTEIEQQNPADKLFSGSALTVRITKG
jgi:hypothetical protein